MSQIYALADHVLVWLGPTSSTSTRAIDTLRLIAYGVDVDWENETSRPSGREDVQKWFATTPSMCEFLFTLKRASYHDDEDIQAIYELFDRVWFERLWVYQEIVLGSERAIIICGSDTIWWTDFTASVLALSQKPDDWSNPDIEHWQRRSKLVMDICRWSMSHVPSLYAILGNYEIKSTNALDRLYGCLGVLNDRDKEEVAQIGVDYRRTPNELYREIVLAQLSHSRKLDCLEYCVLDDRPWSPSWVPNFTKGVDPIFLTPWGTAYLDAASVAYVNNATSSGVLRVDGLIVATVTEVRVFDFKNVFHEDATIRRESIAEALGATFQGFALNTPYFTSQSATAEVIAELLMPELVGNDMERLKEHENTLCDITRPCLTHNNRTGHLPKSARNCILGFYDRCRNQQLILTDRGYLGMTAVSVQTNDVICIVIGCYQTLVLREKDDGIGCTRS